MSKDNGISRGCRRRTVDLPIPLDDLVVFSAAAPPEVSVAEYIRRIVAYYFGYPLPPAWQRRRHLGVSGERKLKPGRKRN